MNSQMNNNVKQCWFQVNPTANPVPIPYDVANTAALRVKLFKIGEVEYLRRQYTNELFDLSNNFVGWAYNNTEFKSAVAEEETEEDDSDDEEDNLVICTKCDASVDCVYANIYIVNNQKEGDEFKEETCCESCWANLAKMYKREGWEGDDLDDVSDSDEEEESISCPCCQKEYIKEGEEHQMFKISVKNADLLICNECADRDCYSDDDEECADDVSDSDDDICIQCCCTTKMDIRGRCDAKRSAPKFAKCPARIDTALFHITNDYQIYQELALHRDVSDKSEIIARAASNAPYNFSGGGDSIWKDDVERIVSLFQECYQEEIEALEEIYADNF